MMAWLYGLFIIIKLLKLYKDPTENERIGVVLQYEVVIQAFYNYSVWTTYLISTFSSLTFLSASSIQESEDFNTS